MENVNVTMPIGRLRDLIESDTRLGIIAEAVFKTAELDYNGKLRFSGYDIEIIFRTMFPVWYERTKKELIAQKKHVEAQRQAEDDF